MNNIKDYFRMLFFKLYLLILDGGRQRDRERERSICYSTYLFMHWLVLICALTGKLNPQPWGIGMML